MQQEEAFRKQAIAETLRIFDADLQRDGNGSYEVWVSHLALLRDYWANKVLHRDQAPLLFDNFVTSEGFVSSGFRSMLGDVSMRLDNSQPVLQVIRLSEQLKEKGIDLMVGVVPTAMEVFPEKYVDRPELVPADGIVAPYRRKFVHLLSQYGVEVVDLLEVLRAHRTGPQADQLVLKTDYHWSNLGAILSAQAITERLQRYDFVQKARASVKAYSAAPVFVNGLGQSVEVWPVTMPDGRPWEAAKESPILVVGDSNTQIYGVLNPVRDWLPGSPDHADFAAQISRFAGIQASVIAIQGFTPDMLNREPVSTWNGRRVVVWVMDACHVVADLPWGDVRLKDSKPERAQTRLVSPAPDTVLGASGSSVITFTWASVPGAGDYWLDIGTERGGNIFGGYTARATSKTVDLGQYLNGKPIYIQLFAKFDNTLVQPAAFYKFQTQPVKH
jgi:hypothetical protein